ncbi:MAG: vitamin K epoxide reductase family protein [Cellulomonas sp.]|uniref:Membrane protein n=1 Tax=Cellulomonas gelida TaxID=1712 RepID=A0A4Y3KFX1_9CELL|nr:MULTISPECIES: vitamin K epoxide reductase family protein [Cellulomonas]MCR6646651.1 vitamin K epoxide reductase family protein [Cellulomonas sp.]MCR6705889.1 vitamin K epoxide reductase family protein [Cellulomonas sp.]GEA83361.1 membrane protein [Cellulomonas gelida]GGL13916.1 membrane protein [Cellulomonas gelida]
MSKQHPVAELDDDLDLDDVVLDEDPDLLGPPDPAWRRRTAIEMVISGLLGLFASFVLSIEALTLAADKNASASCDLNEVISCSTVAKHWAASLFGFPNAYLGIAAESVVLTVAVALVGGVVFPRWFMQVAQVIYTLGLVFAWWLFGMAYFVIGALCPWCLLITVTTTLVWVGLTRINVRERNVSLPGRAGPWGRRFVQGGNDWFVTIALLVVLAGLVMVKYGYTLF